MPSYWAHTYTLTRCHSSSHVEDGCWPVVTAGAQHGQEREGLLQSESCFGKQYPGPVPASSLGARCLERTRSCPSQNGSARLVLTGRLRCLNVVPALLFKIQKRYSLPVAIMQRAQPCLLGRVEELGNLSSPWLPGYKIICHVFPERGDLAGEMWQAMGGPGR